MLFDFEERKKPFLALKNGIFFKSKNRIFSKGLTHAFGQKNASFFVYVDLVKIRLEIMLTDFPQEKLLQRAKKVV